LLQSELQQTPSAQKLDRHCTPALHDAPMAAFGVHLPPTAQ
jgi:hypothetical protein